MTPLPHHPCPLCGGPNACAAARDGRFDGSCWCMTATIPAAVLARVAEADRGRACICAACAGVVPSEPLSR